MIAGDRDPAQSSTADDALRAAHVAGVAGRVAFCVDAEGNTVDGAIVASTGFPAIDRAFLEQIAHTWMFMPWSYTHAGPRRPCSEYAFGYWVHPIFW
jgi:hypothetical protein